MSPTPPHPGKAGCGLLPLVRCVRKGPEVLIVLERSQAVGRRGRPTCGDGGCEHGVPRVPTVEECQLDENSMLIPIAVGGALAGLVLIVLIAYLIGRKRSHAGYQTI